VTEWVQVQAHAQIDHSRRPARVSDTTLAANMTVSLRKKPRSSTCCCFLVCQPDDEPVTVCFKCIFDLALLGALGFGLFVAFIIIALSIMCRNGAKCMGG